MQKNRSETIIILLDMVQALFQMPLKSVLS